MSLTKASWITGGLGLLGDVFSGTLGALSTARANSENRKQWKRQVRFAIHMAKNAHQYEVQDLRKAGLNPILSATGGNGATAQVPSAAPQQAADVPDFGSTLVNSLNSAATLKNAENQEKAIASQNAVNAAQVEKINAEKKRIEQEIAIKSAQAELGKVGGDIAKKSGESYNLFKDPATWQGFLIPPHSAHSAESKKYARTLFQIERNKQLRQRAINSEKKEFYTSDYSLVKAFQDAENWEMVSAHEKDGRGFFVFKNKKDGSKKTIYYRQEGWN